MSVHWEGRSSGTTTKGEGAGTKRVKPLSDEYILRQLAERPDKINFGPRTRKTFRELLRYRAEKRKLRTTPA
jgi:hypothetical protein